MGGKKAIGSGERTTGFRLWGGFNNRGRKLENSMNSIKSRALSSQFGFVTYSIETILLTFPGPALSGNPLRGSRRIHHQADWRGGLFRGAGRAGGWMIWKNRCSENRTEDCADHLAGLCQDFMQQAAHAHPSAGNRGRRSDR